MKDEAHAAPVDETSLSLIEQHIKQAHKMVGALCNRQREWIMSIPARPDYDPDLIIARALCDADTLLARARSDARARVADWQPIESAPKDKWTWCCHFDARLNQWFYYEAVTSTDDGLSWENNYGESCSPTHWQPLPPPPPAEGERG